MKETLLTVLENTRLAEGIYRLRLTGDTSAITAPGQFVNLKLSGFYLRRPISVCDWTEGELTLIYKVLGHGTEAMTRMTPGAELNVLTGLGNGFDVHNAAQRPLLVGGGVGVPPLYNLAKVLLAAGKRVGVVLGFNTADEVFYADEFRALGCDVDLATADGSVSGVSSRRPSPSAAPSSTISMPAGRCRCCGHCATPCSRTGSSRSKSAWAAVSGPAWAVRAKPNTATSAFARRGPY